MRPIHTESQALCSAVPCVYTEVSYEETKIDVTRYAVGDTADEMSHP